MKRIFTLISFVALSLVNFYAAEINVPAGAIADNMLNWTKDNVYVLQGWVFVDSLDVLNIEAGTLIKGAPGEGETSSALIVSRGGKIVAEGTAEEPIIFTADADDPVGTVDMEESGMWGGLIMLGYGQTNNPGQESIEGITSNLEFGLYGMSDKADEVEDQNAGSLKYVSIRHGGTNIGEGNEINGLTMGACGSGTTISFVEVISNTDDGIELFGGAPRIDHFLVAYCGDDCYDLDQGTRVHGQFLAAVMSPGDFGENFGEHDGGSGDGETSEFIAHSIFSNCTFIGNTSGSTNGAKKAFVLRDNWSGEYHNSVFYDAPVGIYLEWRDDKTNSYDRFMEGNIYFKNNVFFQVDDQTADAMWYIVDSQSDNVPIDTATFKKGQVVDLFNGWNNTLTVDPGVSIADPVPSNANAVASPVYTGLDDWFVPVNFKGAFNPSVTNGHWAGGWTLTYADVTYVDPSTTGIVNSRFNDLKTTVYPNPLTSDQASKIRFSNPEGNNYTFTLYNVSGQIVRSIENITTSELVLDKGNLNSGIYTYALTSVKSNTRGTGKLVVR